MVNKTSESIFLYEKFLWQLVEKCAITYLRRTNPMTSVSPLLVWSITCYDVIIKINVQKSKQSRVKIEWEKAMLTGNPLCLLLRKIEATSATLITRGKEITFKDGKKKITSFD